MTLVDKIKDSLFNKGLAIHMDSSHLLGGILMAIPIFLVVGIKVKQGFLCTGLAGCDIQWFLGISMLVLGFCVCLCSLRKFRIEQIEKPNMKFKVSFSKVEEK